MINFTKGTCDFCLHEYDETFKLNRTEHTLTVNGKVLEFCDFHLKEFYKQITEYIDEIKEGNENV